MKSILVPFYDYYDYDAAASAVSAACDLAKMFDSYLEGLLVIEGENIGMVGTPENPGPAQIAEQIETDFRTLVASAGIAFTSAGASGPRAAWRETTGIESRVVADYGRMFDLIVVRRAASHSATAWRQTCEAAIFESGRPVLLAPLTPAAALGDNIVIAWNGSTETARAIALGLPLLAKATTVTVLTVHGGTVPGPNEDEVCAYLARHGIVAGARLIEPEGRTIGEAILAEVDTLTGDLLLKGAYTHPRLRQMIFGGATEHIIAHAALPVLMAH